MSVISWLAWSRVMPTSSQDAGLTEVEAASGEHAGSNAGGNGSELTGVDAPFDEIDSTDRHHVAEVAIEQSSCGGIVGEVVGECGGETLQFESRR